MKRSKIVVFSKELHGGINTFLRQIVNLPNVYIYLFKKNKFFDQKLKSYFINDFDFSNKPFLIKVGIFIKGLFFSIRILRFNRQGIFLVCDLYSIITILLMTPLQKQAL
jgi:hypothetical protein